MLKLYEIEMYWRLSRSLVKNCLPGGKEARPPLHRLPKTRMDHGQIIHMLWTHDPQMPYEG